MLNTVHIPPVAELSLRASDTSSQPAQPWQLQYNLLGLHDHQNEADKSASAAYEVDDLANRCSEGR